MIHLYQKINKESNMRRKITADSSANLYDRDFPNFTPVPLKIVTSEKEYTDDEELDVAAMQAELERYKGASSSSCPAVADWLDAFDGANEVFAVALTSRLSGCFNAAQIAAADYVQEHPGRRAFVLDSLSTGPELELLVEYLHTLLPTQRSFDEICGALTAYSRRTHLAFALASLSNFAKNGRVSPILAKAVGLLGIRVVGRASTEGELEAQHKCRGEKAAIQKLLDGMLAEGFAGGKVRIRHSFNLPAAELLAEKIQEQFPNCDVKIGENRGLCVFYAEKGGILVGFEDGAPQEEA